MVRIEVHWLSCKGTGEGDYRNTELSSLISQKCVKNQCILRTRFTVHCVHCLSRSDVLDGMGIHLGLHNFSHLHTLIFLVNIEFRPRCSSWCSHSVRWMPNSHGMWSESEASLAWCFRLEMIAASIMNQIGSKESRIENRLLIFMCVFCFICGIPLCTQVSYFHWPVSVETFDLRI